MRNLAELNLNEGGFPSPLPPPSNDEVLQFEQAFGVSLPEDLLSLLRHVNGGHPELDAVGGAGGEYAVNRFHHLTSTNIESESLWNAMTEWRPVLGLQAIPFANTGGDDQFFLDCGDVPPSVKLCLHDQAMRIVQIAPTFEAFIDELSIDPDMH